MGEPPAAWRPHVGQHVYIAGTGKWWTGEHFGAVIVDVRDGDATVKVRYTDGGFKRFPMEELRGLVTEKAGAPAMWTEWAAVPHQEHSTELQSLHEEIMSAVRRKDLERADDLSRQFQALAARQDAVAELQVRLRDAVRAGDFLRAHELQARIRDLEASSSGAPPGGAGAPPGDSATPSASSKASGEDRPLLRQVALRSVESGVAGAGAMTLQVVTLMWLRTTMNYQYRYGLGTMEAMQVLHAEGGLARFYRGIGPALLQGPLSRFGDTAANAGVMAFFDETEARSWPAAVKTLFASAVAASMRIALVPLDTVKTVLQVDGRKGLQVLMSKYVVGGTPVFFHGAMAASAATFVGHYPWFTTFNHLNEVLPDYPDRRKQLLRNAGIGFTAAVVSDTVVNSLRVLKTVRQTNQTSSYLSLGRDIVKEDGVAGLLGRGLKTRLIANGCAGIMFSVLYKTFESTLRTRGGADLPAWCR